MHTDMITLMMIILGWSEYQIVLYSTYNVDFETKLGYRSDSNKKNKNIWKCSLPKM